MEESKKALRMKAFAYFWLFMATFGFIMNFRYLAKGKYPRIKEEQIIGDVIGLVINIVIIGWTLFILFIIQP